ncbi:MAG: cell wall metabolism sensor histidine kinase WalK [Nitrospira sp.]|nr:cell wall metabolism sensor histidine kinase WalK [Nitrospira sp.]
MTWSIRWKVAFGTLVAVACGLLMAGVMTLQSLEQRHLTQFGDALETKTKLVEYGFQPLFHSSAPPTPSSLQETARDLGNRASSRVTLVAEDGTVLADSAVRDADLSAVENHKFRPEIQQAFSTGQGQDIRPSHTTGERTMYRAIRMQSSQGASPLVVRVGLPMVVLDRERSDLQQRLFLALGFAFLVALTLSVWLAHSITKPLSDIASAARRFSSGTQAFHVRTTAQDEVGLLASTLNHMADQLHAKIDELSEDRAQLLAVLTSMVEGVMVLDRRGHVLQMNPALERMFGISRVEARGRSCAELFRHQQLNDLVTVMLRSRTHHQDEIVLPLNGRCLQVEASPAGGERENEASVVLVFHDMTELRRLEKIRKDFVANVSHELRTPLTSIKGYVEALLDGAKDDPAASVKFLEIILKQSDRLNLIIEDLLELSKIESGSVSFKEEPLELRSILDRTLSTIKPIAEKNRHRLITAVDPSLPPVAGDEGRLVQVLTNLLDNAVKYTPTGGTITVGAKLIPSVGSDEPAPCAIELSVADTGIGIPEADRPRVFERFYRVDKARSRELGGTGLGLAIVKHIVEGHGGQVWVEANHPQGSRFVVRLPLSTTTHKLHHMNDASRT